MKDALLLFVLWVFSTTISFSQCPQGELILNNQVQVDYFTFQCPDQDTIFGDLVIGDVNTDIKDLTNMNNVKVVLGGLSIRGTDSLFTLQGLDSINVVKGQISILNNARLKTISTLDSISEVSVEIFINNNEALESLEGLNGIKIIDGDLIISNNPELRNITALTNLNDVNGSIRIHNNTRLKDLSGLKNISLIPNGLSIQKNDSLLAFTGMENVDTIGAFLTIAFNKSLENLTALDNLKDVGGDLFISANEALSDCAGLCNLLNTNGVSGNIGIGGNIGECLNNSTLLPICLTLPVEETTNSAIKVSPNPVKSTLLIDFPKNQSIISVKMFTLSGKSIPLGLIMNNSIDVSGLKSGLYLLFVQTNTAIFHQKIVVE